MLKIYWQIRLRIARLITKVPWKVSAAPGHAPAQKVWMLTRLCFAGNILPCDLVWPVRGPPGQGQPWSCRLQIALSLEQNLSYHTTALFASASPVPSPRCRLALSSTAAELLWCTMLAGMACSARCQERLSVDCYQASKSAHTEPYSYLKQRCDAGLQLSKSLVLSVYAHQMLHMRASLILERLGLLESGFWVCC